MTRPAVGLRAGEHHGRVCLVVTGAPRSARLAVVPAELAARAKGWQPLAGAFDERDGETWFLPRFPLVPGLRYALLIERAVAAETEIPAPTEAAPGTEVVSITPSAEEVPFNLLRVYVSFSAPMSEGWATRAIRVVRAESGEELNNVFLPMEPELWDSSRQRLTLLLDPGRIKRGLAPNTEFGYPLTEGVPVSIVVQQDFRDAEGRPLLAPAKRSYRVGPAIRTRVDPSLWQLTLPRAESNDLLVASFDRPLDHALLRRCLTVLDTATVPVRGEAHIDESRHRWSFTPSSPWRAGAYALRVDSRLEDVAGNSVRRVFDRELHLPEHEPLDVRRLDLPIHTV
jgi:hypothetical protein